MSDAPLEPVDIWQTIAGFRQQGAERSAAVPFHFLVALAKRAATQQGRAKQLLEHKLANAVAACAAKLERVQRPASGMAPSLAGTTALEALADLTRACGQHGVQGTVTNASTAPMHTAPARVELKAAQQHRATWSRLSAEKQLSQALEQPPVNPGPINSHMLVLRSVALMRDASPDYLSRFISYVDTLLALENSDAVRLAPTATAAGGRAKPKPLRATAAKPAPKKK